MNIENSNIPNDNFGEYKIGLCGFRNIGNTCYMNSILQLLIHSKLLVNFLLAKSNPNIESSDDSTAQYEKYLDENIIERLGEADRKRLGLNPNDKVQISSKQFENIKESSLILSLADIINTIMYKGTSIITPISFKQCIDKKIPGLRGTSQQDSHELLNGILDVLIEETGNDSDPSINNVPQSIKDYFEYFQQMKKKIAETNDFNEKKEIAIKFNEYKKNNNDIINKFNGLKYMSNVFGKKRTNSLDTSSTGYNPMIFNLLSFNIDTFKCEECAFESCKYEYTTILSLSVKPTLKECFEQFIEEEIVDRRCEICKCTKSKKRKALWRPGMILFIQLCRFNNLPNGRVWKNNQEVEIPEQIDISEFCDKSMGTDTTVSYVYRLKGISNHLGSLFGGHYTADCLSIIDNKTWYHFDDSRVGKHQNSDIDKSAAYILMYEMEPIN